MASLAAVRILCVANRLDAAGGLERTQLTNCRGLAGRGHRIDLIYVEGGAFAEQWQDFAASMSQVPATLPRRAHPVASTLAMAGAVRRARRLRPDVVYVYRYWDIPFAVAVAAASRAAVVYHLCLPPPPSVPRWLRRVLSRVDTTISVSADTLARWQGSGLRTGRATVVLTSVDLATFVPAPGATRAEARASVGVSPDEFMVFFAGRITPDKGVHVLVEAMRALVGLASPCRLVVLGSPPPDLDAAAAEAYVARLHALAEGLPVVWLPRRPDVAPLLAAADVAVVPSIWPEPLSRSILEPLACGVPVVASRVGGSAEVLRDWLEAYLVEPDDPEALAACLASLAGWRTHAPDLGARCRAFAEAHLDPKSEFTAIEAAMAAAAGSDR